MWNKVGVNQSRRGSNDKMKMEESCHIEAKRLHVKDSHVDCRASETSQFTSHDILNSKNLFLSQVKDS